MPGKHCGSINQRIPEFKIPVVKYMEKGIIDHRNTTKADWRLPILSERKE